MDAKEEYRKRDRVIGTLSEDKMIRAVLVKSSKVAQIAQQRHQLEAIPACYLAKAMSGGALLASLLKGEERITLIIKGDRAIETIYAEAFQVGEIRGYAHLASPEAERIAECRDSLGKGHLHVNKVLYGKFKPVNSVIALEKGDVGGDLENYLNVSEQVFSKVFLECTVDPDGKVRDAVGLMLQAMPGADHDKITAIAQNVPDLAGLLQQDKDPMQMIAEILPYEFEVTNNTPLDFFCRCSMDRFKAILLGMQEDELRDMQSKGQDELTCQYCNEVYKLQGSDFESLIAEVRARKA